MDEKISYKETLNLPRTDFSMKANLTSLEPKFLAHWQKLDIYRVLRLSRQGKEKFILHDGPPYANGLIHIGHALNKILKDIVLKYMVMQNKDCPFIIGWDCHGLPVEHQLFKELKLTKHDVKIEMFRKNAKEFALQFVQLQKEDFKRLGIFSDWDNPYFTLQPEYEYAVMKLLEYLTQEGYIYRGRKPVNWCATCETALAEAEVEYENHRSPSVYVKFKAKELSKNAREALATNGVETKGGMYFVIWTTTPWTLIANVAIALHAHEQYVVLSGPEGELWVVAQRLVTKFLSVIGKESANYRIVFEGPGSLFEGCRYEHPFGLRIGSVVLADYVSMEEGTGCVHTAPGHGQEDYLTGKKYGLEIVMPIDDKGKFDAESGEWAGLSVESANEKIIEKLKTQRDLLFGGSITHSYPHCWRCKKPIIFRATFQWFMRVDHLGLREKLLAEIEKVQWVPSGGKERMRGMLVARPDWCLSRQRLWGIPIPAIQCAHCQEVILASAVIKQVAEIFKTSGSDSWFTLDIEKFLPPEFSCPHCGNKTFSKQFDILDVWFESGASFFAVLKQNPQLQFPADMYLEGSDQHRGWFQVSLIPSVAKEQVSPFKTILTHGFVVDGEGKKMSKSIGNVIAPQEIIKKYGAEILRLWAACSDYSEDVKISEEILKQLVDIYRKVRNTIKFILGNLYDFNPEDYVFEYERLPELDRFMLSKTVRFYREVKSCYTQYSFYKVCQEVFNFCNLDLSSFYLDILKDRLYTLSPNSHERRSSQFVLSYMLGVLLKSIAPILSFTAEEAYSMWSSAPGKKESIFVTEFSDEDHPEWLDEGLISRWEKIIELRGAVLKEIEKKREAQLVGSSLETEVFLSFKGESYTWYKDCVDMLREIFIVSGVTVTEGEPTIRIERTNGKKCLRCWNYRSEVGSNQSFPHLCDRCVKALEGGR
ncbi:MAG: isoleucine--tRNA ligase [Candidatus Omnitrophota bacterium]